MESTPTFNPQSTIGAYQIGVLISYMLFGVTTTQAYIYYSRFLDDSRKLKALVAAVWFGELGHAICIGHTLYAFTVLDYGHPERLLGPAPKSLEASMLLGSIAVTSVQVFFAFRIYKFSKKLQIPILSWTFSFVRQLAALIIFVTALRPIPVATYDPKRRWLFLIYLSVSSTNDLTITVAFVVMLLAQRPHVSARTKALVDKLIGWSIETRMPPTLFGMATLACYVSNSENFIWLAMFAISTRSE
ncbi:hypothetical protein DFH08DRAFT_971360 [Mycena albidolilacea]|uniref:DUF6534 domain-containing protein n=1 Tax=Mycena albidolilacea TaxID=1033008 RepID=A0AAD6ZDF5_9AGAR|nr:hypothetical protein DFH08DRAFT_971360 [Mycena albidolilacea]